MKRHILFLVLIISLVGCRTAKQIAQPPVLKDSIRIVEKLVPVQLPADSSFIEAFFQCDSTNQVIMKALSEEKTKRINSQFKFTSGNTAKLIYKAKTQPDTVYIRGKDTTVYKDRPVYIDKPVITNELHWWQKALMWCGGAFLILLAIAIYKQIKPFI